MIKQEGIQRAYQRSRRQMDFISAWQKYIDVREGDVHSMVNHAMHMFLNYFNNDGAVYVRYQNQQPEVFYNNTSRSFDAETLSNIAEIMKEEASGFVVSKISGDFTEHEDIIEYFGGDEVCSLVAVPFFDSGELSSLLITFVRMKDNWHSSISRYMLDNEDLNIYQLLIREMNYAIVRMESYKEICQMNDKLSQAAVTDSLTGIYNRAGLYEEIQRRYGEEEVDSVGVMFVDLDNFKHYNDTYGHDIGDLVLVEMARIFSKVSKEHGFVGRYGGDEFILFFDNCDKQQLEETAKDIYMYIEQEHGFRRQIEEKKQSPVEMDEKRLITCSIGIALAECVRGEEKIQSVIKSADNILYKIKTSQKGHYAFL